MAIGFGAMAQQSIQLRSANKAECVKSDMRSLKASFSFSSIQAQDYESERGTFSWLSLPNTVRGGNEGEPQIPVVNELIAVPFGAHPRIEVTSYSTTDYRLDDYDMKTLVPRQPSLRKDQRPEDVPFVYNANAYQTRGLRSAPQAVVSVEGTMRGVQLGKMTIEPVSYDPVNNTIRVFNDIEVTVHFDGADRQATEQMLIDTYSPYFDIVYKSLFNGRAIASVYDDHPDLYSTPVKMLVVTTSTYVNSTAFQNWLTWKKQKGIDVDVQTVASGATASTIKNLIYSRYNANHPSFLVIVGDETVVTYYSLWDYDSSYGNAATDLEYASVDGDIYHDMFISRMPVSSTSELDNLVNKTLTYEKYTMSDPSYLNETLLIAGWDDDGATAYIGKPTIQYANNYYFNSAHGITPHVFITTASGQTTCYNYINNVGFVNYTAHGDIQKWHDPEFTNSNVNSLTNNDKYFWAMGNCCLTANFKNARNSQTCFGETMVRAANKGAFGYIGSVPESLWYEDYYFALGATNTFQTMPTQSQTATGAYDALFDDTGFNTLNSVPFIGNVAVSYAYSGNYTTSGSNGTTYEEYYWRAYQCFGDGSVMPYLKNPSANNVSHASNIAAGANSFRVNADARSYVSITVNNEIIGVAAVPANATYVDVPFTTTPQPGQTAMIVVTRNQRQPYITTVPVVSSTSYTITASVNPTNSGTVSGAGTYYADSQCTLTATPNHGYAFDNWKLGNSVVSTEPSYTFTVTGNATYTADFHALQIHNITYTPQQTNGTISVSPTSAYAGDIITLTATPAAGYCLDQWHVTTGRTEIPVVNNQFTMPDSDVTITATFKSGYTVTVASVANGTITATPTTAMPGDIITLTATPNSSCEFTTWYVYKTEDPSVVVTVLNNSFTMPSYDVTVSAVFATTTSGDVTIGSGSGTNQYLPTYAYYNYSLTQQIYTAAEVGEAGTITAIAFKVANSKSATRNLAVYIRPTTLTAFASTTGWESMGDVYKVFEGNVNFSASDWTTINLDTPFEYDGTKNINICVVDNTGSYITNSSDVPTFLSYSTNANRAMRVYNDNDAYSVGTSGQISSYTGAYVTSNNQIKLTKVLKNAQTLSVSPDAINDFSYQMGMGPSNMETVNIVGADLSNDITVTAPTNFEISTTANGTYGQSLTIPRERGRGGRVETNWGFEGSFENWTTIEADGDAYNWVLGSAVSGVYLESGNNFSTGHDGSSDMLVSGSYSNVAGALHPDNWLVSPQVTLGGTFSMFAMASDASWFAEHFGIYVSTTGNANTSSFTLLNEWTLQDGDWHEYTVDLSAYAGQTGYIAVRHFNCTNMFLLLVDDFKLDTEASFTPDLPVAITPATVYVRMKSNLNIGSYSGNLTVASGTLNKTVSLSGEVYPASGEQYTIAVNASPENGGTVTGGGTYYEQSTVTLTATPSAHYTFTGWQLNGTVVSTSTNYEITVTGNATYTALFSPSPQYSVSVVQAEGGTITANPTMAYPGDVIDLSVTPSSGYFFVEWIVRDGNNQSITVTNDQFTMPNSNVTVTAVFSQGFMVNLEQTPNGTISADQTQQLQPGDVVTLTATPNNGCVFLAWYVYKTGDPRAVISVVNDSWFFMPASDVTVQAIFVTEEEQQAQLGSGTSTNNYIPTYVRANYSLTQQIYLASELGNQQGRITKIAFRANNRTATRNLIIYMAHTEKSSFSSTTDWEIMGTVAKVFEGSVAFGTSDFTTITLDTPFDYDGTSNINICVVDNTGSTSGSSSRYTNFYHYSATNRALYVNGSSSYANTVGYSSLSSTTGTRISYVNRINITMLVPGSAESLTVSPGAIDDFTYEEGQGPSITNKLGIVGVDLSNNITVNAPTNFEISLTENGTYSSSLTIPRETGSKNRNVITWSFEGTLDGWTALDADGDGYNWVLGSACGGVYLVEGSNLTEGHDGSDMMVSGSYTNVIPEALDPDNWLISPQVALGGSFSMWAKGNQPAYPAEHFGIYVSTTGTNPSDFTLLNEYTATATWKNYSVDLSAYAGMSGYIAVRHFGMAGNDQFILDVDDFVLDTDAAITIEMPVTITPATVYVRLKENLDAGEYNGTLTASAGSGDNLNGSVSLGGTVNRSNYWTPVQVGPNTMTVIAQVQLDGVPVTPRSQWELGAFCGTECRGSVIGLDDEPVFFLTVYGNEGDQNTFLLYDRAGEAVSQGVCYFAANYLDNDVIGTYENPVVLNFVTTPVFTKDIIGYTPNTKDRYYLVASPIGTVSPTNVNNMLTNAYDLYYFDQNPSDGLEWRNYEHNTFNLVAGKGYLYANSQSLTLTFSGNAYFGNGEVTLAKTGSNNFSGWNLVGNPFAQTAYIDREFYTMNDEGTDIIAGTGNSVAAMDGIFVIAQTDGETMTFSTGMVAKAPGQIVLNVSNELGNTIDRAIVHIGEGGTLPKFMLNPSNTKVYIPQDGTDFAVIRGEGMGEIPVSFKASKNATFTIDVNAEMVDVRYLHLIDNKTGADVDVLRTPTYTFDATPNDYASRFKLVFVCGNADDDDTFAFYSNGSWIVSNDGEAILQVVDVTGRIMSSRQIEGCHNLYLQAAPGVYMLRLIKGDDVRVQKIVVD